MRKRPRNCQVTYIIPFYLVYNTLFTEGDKSIGENIRGAYGHLNGWRSRLILGDSLKVMNSLLDTSASAGRCRWSSKLTLRRKLRDAKISLRNKNQAN